MAHKKSFKGNPALQFIGTPEHNFETHFDETMGSASAIETDTKADRAISTQEPLSRDPMDNTAPAPQKRKHQADPSAAAPTKNNSLYVETKSRRVQLLMQPSLYAKLKERARQEDVSVNELIHGILADGVEIR